MENRVLPSQIDPIIFPDHGALIQIKGGQIDTDRLVLKLQIGVTRYTLTVSLDNDAGGYNSEEEWVSHTEMDYELKQGW